MPSRSRSHQPSTDNWWRRLPCLDLRQACGDIQDARQADLLSQVIHHLVGDHAKAPAAHKPRWDMAFQGASLAGLRLTSVRRQVQGTTDPAATIDGWPAYLFVLTETCHMAPGHILPGGSVPISAIQVAAQAFGERTYTPHPVLCDPIDANGVAGAGHHRGHP